MWSADQLKQRLSGAGCLFRSDSRLSFAAAAAGAALADFPPLSAACALTSCAACRTPCLQATSL